jgi:serine/threonine protein kinase
VAGGRAQVLDALKRLHSTGIVHRDVKPANLVLMGNRFRLIDFGAATDLRVGINYDPELSLLDPGYCPPEQYVMPGASPLSPPRRAVASVVAHRRCTALEEPVGETVVGELVKAATYMRLTRLGLVWYEPPLPKYTLLQMLRETERPARVRS